MTDKIRPPHAITIWSGDNILYAELPDATGKTNKTHQLRLPLNVFGITHLCNILKQRTTESQLSSKGDPTAAQSEAIIKEMQKKAAGFTGKVRKPLPKVKATPELAQMIRGIIRKCITT